MSKIFLSALAIASIAFIALPAHANDAEKKANLQEKYAREQEKRNDPEFKMCIAKCDHNWKTNPNNSSMARRNREFADCSTDCDEDYYTRKFPKGSAQLHR